MVAVIQNVNNNSNNIYAFRSTSNKPVWDVPDDKFAKNNEEEKKKKTPWLRIFAITAGGGIAAFLAAVAAMALFCKGKTLEPANLAEHIDFVKAKTMDEAKKFAKDNLGIKHFDLGKDVEMANWVNKGLVNINNRFKGKANMPVEICWDKSYFISEPSALAYCSDSGRIAFNKKAFSQERIEKVRSRLQNMFPYFDETNIDSIELNVEDKRLRKLTENLYDNYRKMLLKPEKYTRFDAMYATMLFEDLDVYFARNGDKAAAEWLKDSYGKSVKSALRNKSKKGSIRANSIYDVLYHEMGHMLHNMNTSLKDKIWGKLGPGATKEFQNNAEKQKIAGKVSLYAHTNQYEFVAECFNAMCAGRKLPDDVMKMYQEYKGQMLPSM